MSHTTQPIPSTSEGVAGSIRWGIDHGRCFDIKGIYRYGREITDADSHEDALNIVLSWDCLWNDETFTFITPKAIEVWRVGPRFDYMRTEKKVFSTSNGRAVEITDQTCPRCHEFGGNPYCICTKAQATA